jgi:hypothetical protein
MPKVYCIIGGDGRHYFDCPIALKDYLDSVSPGRYDVDVLAADSKTPRGSVVKHENGEFSVELEVRRDAATGL